MRSSRASMSAFSMHTISLSPNIRPLPSIVREALTCSGLALLETVIVFLPRRDRKLMTRTPKLPL